jgi:hypothetical protein
MVESITKQNIESEKSRPGSNMCNALPVCVIVSFKKDVPSSAHRTLQRECSLEKLEPD